ncbi:hypothetical protein HWV62_13341 [Athelia sp. TMB]|nr:hypothetical protein HWV62_13341 [Athelia sp. TMB]
MPKSCLRCPTPPSTPALGHHHQRKCVAFCAEELEQVFAADEWDRTPTEAAQKLSYGDILELKAIQRSLPIARQLPDPLARRPQTQYLQKVRIGLLPMYDDNEGQLCNSVTVPPIYPSNLQEPIVELPPVPSRSPSLSGLVPTALSQAPVTASDPPAVSTAADTPPRANIYSVRPKPGFSFLPLLDSPAPPTPATTPPASHCSDADTDGSETDLSTPALSNASLDTTPSPREHPAELDGADSYFQLEPRHAKEDQETHNPYFPPSSAYASTPPTQPSCYSPSVHSSSHFGFSMASPSVQFKRKPFTPFHPPPPPAEPEEDAEEGGDFFMINGEKYHFGPSSTPPDSPVLAPTNTEEQEEVPLSPISPALAESNSALFAADSSAGVDLPPSISRAPAPSIPTLIPVVAPSVPVPCSVGAYSPDPEIVPFCVNMKRAPRVGTKC